MYKKIYHRDVPSSGPPSVVYIGPEPYKQVKILQANGKYKVFDLTPTGKMKVESEYWWARIKLEDGKTWKEFSLCKNRTNAESIKAAKVKEIAAKRAGTFVAVKEYKKMDDYVKAWIGEKRRDQKCKRYVDGLEQHIKIIFKSLNIQTIEDLIHPKFDDRFQELIDKWLNTPTSLKYNIHEVSADSIPNQPEFTHVDVANIYNVSRRKAYRMLYDMKVPFTIRDNVKYYTRDTILALIRKRAMRYAPNTINLRITALKDFTTYLVRLKVITPRTTVPLLNDKVDIRKRRRAVTWEDCLNLCRSVISCNKTWRSMEPFSRSVLYRTAFCTLARRRALAELRVYDLNLDAPTPFMSIRAETDKTRTARAIPIMNKDLLEDLKTLIAGKKRDDLVFHVAHATAAVLQNDLKDANIPYSTTEGDWDFHAFRHSGATHMARMRVPLYQICKIGGWTDYEQFFSTYGHMSVHDLGSSIDGIF